MNFRECLKENLETKTIPDKCPDCGNTGKRRCRHLGTGVWCSKCDYVFKKDEGRYKFNKDI